MHGGGFSEACRKRLDESFSEELIWQNAFIRLNGNTINSDGYVNWTSGNELCHVHMRCGVCGVLRVLGILGVLGVLVFSSPPTQIKAQKIKILKLVWVTGFIFRQ